MGTDRSMQRSRKTGASGGDILGQKKRRAARLSSGCKYPGGGVEILQDFNVGGRAPKKLVSGRDPAAHRIIAQGPQLLQPEALGTVETIEPHRPQGRQT